MEQKLTTLVPALGVVAARKLLKEDISPRVAVSKLAQVLAQLDVTLDLEGKAEAFTPQAEGVEAAVRPLMDPATVCRDLT